MTYFPTPQPLEVSTSPSSSASVTADGRTRTAQLTPIFDGKVLFAEDTELFTSAGTGTATWAAQSVVLSVTAGQYMIRQSRQYFPYASGYPKVSEITFQDFQLVPGLIKRFGLFSSNAVAPYTANYDGWYIESNGDDNTYYLVVVNNGVENLRLPWTQWSGYADIAGYNWENFTVSLTDFLWLGGAVLRTYLKMPNAGFVLGHQYDYAGTQKGVFMESPNQPLRYEIRSTTGTGVFTTICSQVATEGAITTTGKPKAIYTPIRAVLSIGTTYAIAGVRASALYRDQPTKISFFGLNVTSPDSGTVLLLRNPTLSAPLVWTANGYWEQGSATTQTVTAPGWIVAAFPITSSGVVQNLANNSLSWLSLSIANIPDEFILAYVPLTTQQSVAGVIEVTQY